MKTGVYPPTKRMLTRAEAAAYCGIGATRFPAVVRVSPVEIGTRLLYDVRTLDRWLDQQSQSEPTNGDDWLGLLDED